MYPKSNLGTPLERCADRPTVLTWVGLVASKEELEMAVAVYLNADAVTPVRTVNKG